MQKIDGSVIRLNRGDELNLTLTLKYSNGDAYTFEEGDRIIFSVYAKKKMDGNALMFKEIVVESASASIDIDFTSSETKIGGYINKPVEHWYEVELNGKYTVIGYDENGPKVLMLYPEGSQIVT